MANPIFDPSTHKEDAARGGFDAGSYRQPQPAQAQRALTPAQQRLAKAEKAMPAFLKNRVVAIALALAVLLGGVVGVGGGKLAALAAEARGYATAGLAEDGGYTLAGALTTRGNAAANIITSAIQTEGIGAQDALVVQAQQCLQSFWQALEQLSAGGSNAHQMYQQDQALGAAVNQLYARMQELAADPFQMGAVQGQYGSFTSAATVLGALGYNEAVQQYNQAVSGLPASVLGALWGAQPLELFA